MQTIAESTAPAAAARAVFITGGTGYLGRPLIEGLLARGRTVRALVRQGSQARLPRGCEVVVGDALDPSSYASAVRAGDVFVHLVGVAHPSPRKAAEFRSVDLASVVAATVNAQGAAASRFVYVSVAQPAPVMKAYLEVRAKGESLVRATGIPATALRPWYVLGPRHWWPLVLLPFYALAALVPAMRASGQRLGLVTRGQMLLALIRAIDSTAPGLTTVDVPGIRASRE